MSKKLFKKIETEVCVVLDYIRRCYKDHEEIHHDVRDGMGKIIGKLESQKRLENTIVSQQRTIEQLTNALKDKYEHGLFIVSEDCKTPMVIRDGKEVIGEYTKWFRIEWTPGEAPTIETEQMVGTWSEDNE